MTKYKKMIVHGSRPHTDDAMCAAIAKILNPNIIIERCNEITDEMRNDPEIIICDIGGGKYDHHQEDAKIHEDGEKYAACTLLFEEFKNQLFKTEEGKASFEQLLRIVEHTDNTGDINALSNALNKLNPTWNEKDLTNEDIFFQMVDKLKTLIEAQIAVEKNLLFKIFSNNIETGDDMVHKINAFFEYSIAMLGINHFNNLMKDYDVDLSCYRKYNCLYKEIIDDLEVEKVPFSYDFILKEYDLDQEYFLTNYRSEMDEMSDIVDVPHPIKYALCAMLYQNIDQKFLFNAIETNDHEALCRDKEFGKNYRYLMEQFKLVHQRKEIMQEARKEADKLLATELIPNAKNNILELEFGLPWKLAAQNSTILFAITPDERTGGYLLQTASLYKNIPIIKIPQDIECKYVHHSGHMAVFESKEDALKCAKSLIEKATKDKTFEDILSIFCDFDSNNLYNNFEGILRSVKLYMEIENLSLDQIIEEAIKNIKKFDNQDFIKSLVHTLSVMSEKGINVTKNDLIDAYKEFFTTNITLQLSDGSGYVFDEQLHFNYEENKYEGNNFVKYEEKEFEKFKETHRENLEYLYESEHR